LMSLFTSLILLILIGNIASVDTLIYVALAILILGWAAGSLSPVVLAISQKLSPTRRGALAGLLTFSMFVGNALVPITYESFYAIGMSTVYSAILIVSLFLVIILALFTKNASLARDV